ncbi:GIN domain-containing protein [Dyadobacter chenhuakuii]|uniref:DUF2807 domain-containing protein n=1 Tax=Dyadobacter chenhuakuii TaxID=2909339 RepID=A0ABY4XT46_9BACT|nr:DUF2807 domain-containing protein [Dyadobacter chenhuakuii]MCF2492426.1 DUF2807 domain-containing protein [Dyadobacter chenhuakuii]USJ33272.1 DUF2807 domain-containing protein [Dyadobacter chenhuakuii]
MINLFYVSVFALMCSTVVGQGMKTEIVGNKQMTNSSREIPNFSHLRIIGLDVDLQKGQTNSISLTAESNIIEHIASKVDGDTLVIHYERNQPLRNVTSPKIMLTYSNGINSILGSVSNIKLLSPLENDDLVVKLQTKSSITGMVKLNSLNLRMETSCNAALSGSANDMHAELFTKSNLNARDLAIKNLDIVEETHCKSELNVSEQLTAKLFVESTLNNVGNAKPDITYPSMDQMTSMKSFSRNVDMFKFN